MNNYVISNRKKNVHSLEHDIGMEDSTEVDSLTEIFNFIKGELDLIGKK